MSKVQDIKKSSLTFAPEAGSQRLRDGDQQGFDRGSDLNGARQAFEAGWNRVKLYFMLGLPTERWRTWRGIALLSEKVAETYYEIPGTAPRKVQVTPAPPSLCPSPLRPSSGPECAQRKNFWSRANIVRVVPPNAEFQEFKIQLARGGADGAEGILARGDRRVGAVIEAAYKNGAIYDSWSEYFNNDAWMKAFEDCGVPIDFIPPGAKPGRSIPWDFIDAGVSKEFLKERVGRRAMEAVVTPNCRASARLRGA